MISTIRIYFKPSILTVVCAVPVNFADPEDEVIVVVVVDIYSGRGIAIFLSANKVKILE